MQTKPFPNRASTRIAAALLAAFTFSATQTESQAQGCVIARGSGGVCPLHGHDDGMLDKGDWQAAVGYRWLHSFRHFADGEEQKQRLAGDNEVVNKSHFVDISGTYAVTRQFWATLSVPFSQSSRSSWYEHSNPRRTRHYTYAAGIGDVRLTGTYWILDPEKYSKGNFAVTLGVKAPTGDYDDDGARYRRDAAGNTFVTRETDDSSIQPGDGGWGAILELQGYHQIYKSLSGYFNANYLFNPRESTPAVSSTNPTLRYSTPDSYLFRLGLMQAIPQLPGFGVTFGARMEGVPSTDFFGEDGGFRRPGYAISVEPGLALMKGKFSWSLTTPVALYRHREENYLGQRGDAAFADFTVNSSFAWKF